MGYLNKLKFNTKDQNVYFIGDLHKDHDRDFIWGKRGYKSVHEMNGDIFRSWNTTVTENDIVFNLGDIIFGDSDGSKLVSLVETLKCKTHYLIWGNHTSGHRSIYKMVLDEYKKKHNIIDNIEIYPLSAGKLVFLGDYVEIEVNNTPIILSHYPIASWNGFSHGAINIHGHCHCNLKENVVNRIDVGWDFKKKPVSFEEIKQHLKFKGGNVPDDHHYLKNNINQSFFDFK